MSPQATSPNQFGVSWLAARDQDEGCADECAHISDPEPECSPTERLAAEDHCAALFDRNGPFQVGNPYNDREK